MPRLELSITGIHSLQEVAKGDDLAELIALAIRSEKLDLLPKDIIVITHKVVSKAEGRLVQLETIIPSCLAEEWAKLHNKDPRVVELILRQSHRIVRMEKGILITETKHGFVCANAGVDCSNVPKGMALLLPKNPDLSARQLRDSLVKEFGVSLAIIITDTFGRPWRDGQVNFAIGVAGLEGLRDYRGEEDTFGRKLEASVIAVADELAAAAELVMGKTQRIPLACIRGFDFQEQDGSGQSLIRPLKDDLFR